MASEETVQRTRKVIADLLGIPEPQVTEEAHFVKDLGMESVQSVELIAALEEEFDIDIDQDEVADIFTLPEAADWIEKQL